jgi:hypothetical protein
VSDYQNPAPGFVLLTPAASPSATATRYRACYTDTDGTYKIVCGDGTAWTGPLFKGMNPVEIRGVYSTPTPAGTVWGVP